MKNKLNSKSVFFTLRVSAAVGFCLVAIAAMLLAMATIDPAHGRVQPPASTNPTSTAAMEARAAGRPGRTCRALVFVRLASISQRILTVLVLLLPSP